MGRTHACTKAKWSLQCTFHSCSTLIWNIDHFCFNNVPYIAHSCWCTQFSANPSWLLSYTLNGVWTEWNMVMQHLIHFKMKIWFHLHSVPLRTVNHLKWQCALLSNSSTNHSDKRDIISKMGLLKCALILKATVKVLSYPSPYLLSSYLITLHFQRFSFIVILILCVLAFVHGRVCYPRVLAR